jgi:hypothetical protein
MATEILRPNAAGDVTALFPSGASFNWDCVNDVTPDGLSTYVVCSIEGYDLYNIPNTSIPDGATINSVTVYAYCNADYPGNYAKVRIKTGGTEYYSALLYVAQTPSWTLISETWNTNPKSSLAWTKSDLNALQIGVYLIWHNQYYPYTRCTQVYVEIDYTGPETYTKTVDIDALLQTTGQSQPTVDAKVKGTGQKTVALNAYVGEPFNKETQLDSLLRQSISQGVSLDTLLGKTSISDQQVALDTIIGETAIPDMSVLTRVEAMDYMSQLSASMVQDYEALGLQMTYISQTWSYGGIIYAFDADDDYFYAVGASDQKIRKFSRATGAQVAESAAQDNPMWAIIADGDYLYIGLQRDAPYNDYVVGKFLKSNLSLSIVSSDYGAVIYALTADDTHIFAAGALFNGNTNVKKYLKSNLSYVTQGGSSAAAIWAMDNDDTHIYVATYAAAPYDYYIVRKLLKSDLSYVAQGEEGSNLIRAIKVSGSYIYAGDEGGIVKKYAISDMSTSATSAAYGGVVLAVDVSESHVYIAGATTNKIYRLFINNLTKSDESPSYGGNIWDLFLDGDYIYAGGATTITIRKYQLFQTVDEVVDELLDFPMQPPAITKGDISDFEDEVVPLNIDGQTLLQAFLALRKPLGGYMEVNNDRELDWFASIGEDKGQQIRYGKNLLGIYREIDYTKLFNRIYVYGRDADGNVVKLSDIQDEDYVEDTDSQDTYGDGVNPYIGVGVFVDFSIPGAQALLDWANELLAQYKDPPTTYSINAVDLSTQQGFDFEALQLGSTVKVIDEDLGIDIEATVVRLYYPDLSKPHEMQVELDNAVRDITDSMANLAQGQKKHDMLLVNP